MDKKELKLIQGGRVTPPQNWAWYKVKVRKTVMQRANELETELVKSGAIARGGLVEKALIEFLLVRGIDESS